MLEGVVPFPPEFAKKYREKGYWLDKSLAQEFEPIFANYAGRIAFWDGDRSYTYKDIDQISDRLALNLLDLGLKTLDRVVVQLPNVIEFVVSYFALQKIGCIPIAALATHRYMEVSQFVALSGATTCIFPDRQGDFDFRPMIARVKNENACLKFGLVLGEAGEGFLSLRDLIAAPSKRDPKELKSIVIEPTDPAIFQLSGGTTGVPKLIPRTHNDYAYNSKAAVKIGRAHV